MPVENQLTVGRGFIFGFSHVFHWSVCLSLQFFVENWLIWVFYSANSGNKSLLKDCFYYLLKVAVIHLYSDFPHHFFQCIFLVCGLWSLSSSVSSVIFWLDRFPQTSGSKKKCVLFKSFDSCYWGSCWSPRQSWNKEKYLLWSLRAPPLQTKCIAPKFWRANPYCPYWHSLWHGEAKEWGIVC